MAPAPSLLHLQSRPPCLPKFNLSDYVHSALQAWGVLQPGDSQGVPGLKPTKTFFDNSHSNDCRRTAKVDKE